MSSSVRACFGLITLTSLFAFVACNDDDDVVVGGAGESSEAGAPTTAGGGGTGGSASSPAGGASDGGAMHGGGSLECEVLGELCHAADSGTGPAHDCHELGHVGNVAACSAGFADCIGVCTDANIGSGGAGGDDPKCAALGSLCHEAGEIDADAQECHELGHVGNPATCAEQFDSCATLCLAILDTIEEGGEGGAGGAGAGGAAQGGAATGGAGGAQ